jgi:hypothetical protein
MEEKNKMEERRGKNIAVWPAVDDISLSSPFIGTIN